MDHAFGSSFVFDHVVLFVFDLSVPGSTEGRCGEMRYASSIDI